MTASLVAIAFLQRPSHDRCNVIAILLLIGFATKAMWSCLHARRTSAGPSLKQHSPRERQKRKKTPPQDKLKRSTTPSIVTKAALPLSANLTITKAQHPNKVRKLRKLPVDSEQKSHKDENTLRYPRPSVLLCLKPCSERHFPSSTTTNAPTSEFLSTLTKHVPRFPHELPDQSRQSSRSATSDPFRSPVATISNL